MKLNKLKLSAYFLILFISACTYCFSESNSDSGSEVDTSQVVNNDDGAKPYSPDEFPQWSKDLRRSEIVTFGSFPFVTLGVSTGFGAYKYFSGKVDTFPNPFSTNGAFEKKEILQIVGISAGISVGIGITDFIISYSRRKKAERQKAMQKLENKENIHPISCEEASRMLHENTRKYNLAKAQRESE